MSLIRFEGIILKTSPYKENGKIVTVFTPNKGKITVIGHSSQKLQSQNGATLQVGNFVQGIYYKKQEMSSMGTLNQIAIKHQFTRTKMDFTKLALSQYAIEFVLKNTEDDESNYPIYQLLLKALKDIEENPIKPSWRHMWDYHALKRLGFEPVFDHCSMCGKELQEGVWVPREGGLTCNDHELYGFRVTRNDLIELKEIAKRFDSKKECHLSPAVKEAFSRMINEYCGGPFKTLTFYGIS